MATCVVQQSASPITHPRTYLPTTTHDSMACRKRLLSEQNDSYTSTTTYLDDDMGINKRTRTGLFPHESKDNNQHHGMQSSTLSSFESKRDCRSAPGLLRQTSFTHPQITYIKNVSSAQTIIPFSSPLSKTTSTTTKTNMLQYEQNSLVINANENDTDDNSIFLTCAQLAVSMTAMNNNLNGTLLIIDCGSPLRHTERRIQDSLLLNVNDKISRKRLSTRGLKNFLDTNQLNRLDKNEIIILYDDFIRPTSCNSSVIQTPLSPSMKCIYDEIKRYDTNKRIYILQSPFNDFYQQYPSLCYISTSTDTDLSPSEPMTAKPVDIESYQMSEILPGLYLGNSRDAEDRNLLKQHEIKSIVNISTSIPCHFESEGSVDYLRLPCHDTCNQHILQYFESTFEYIHQKLTKDKNVLVHCQGGVSRSPSFIIGYLMKFHSKTFDEAHNLVRNKRSIVNPNLNFLGQLTQYQQMLTSA